MSGKVTDTGGAPSEEPIRPHERPVLVIEAGKAERRYWQDLWEYRELLYFLARRDVSVRYKQTAIGISWAVLRPLITVVIFTVVFGRIAALPSEGVPYSLLVFAAMLPWFFFATALADVTNSLVGNSNLLSKIYFPRLLIPMSAMAASLVDLAISFVLFVLVMAWYGYLPSWRWVALPAFLLLAMALVAGLGLWFSALNVRYRDFRFIALFVVQVGLYISPVGFSSSVIPAKWWTLYALNPMVGVIEGFRWALLGGELSLRADALIIAAALTIALIASGLWYFRHTERSFADVI